VTAQDIIGHFQLEPHPEGGWYKRVFESSGKIRQMNLPPQFTGDRFYVTSIYYLLQEGQFSAFHRLKQDEVWHLYMGGPLRLYRIDNKGNLLQDVIGHDFADGQIPQISIDPGIYFAAELLPGSDFAFVGCTVAPGFEFKDFQLGNRVELLDKYPSHTTVIERLTKI